jgi:hypothetical protein
MKSAAGALRSICSVLSSIALTPEIWVVSAKFFRAATSVWLCSPKVSQNSSMPTMVSVKKPMPPNGATGLQVNLMPRTASCAVI